MPKIHSEYRKILTKGWDENLAAYRTEKAIEYISYFMPSFSTAVYGGKPLFGAQQIPGRDSTLRANDVSFEKCYYARA